MCALFILFTFVPILELFLLVKISEHIGFLQTLSIVVITGFLGAALARLEGLSTIIKIRHILARGGLPTVELLNGLLIVVGAVLLITPGVLTDLLGLAMLFPPTRVLIRKALAATLKRKVKFHFKATRFPDDFEEFGYHYPQNEDLDNPEVIEGEAREIPKGKTEQ